MMQFSSCRVVDYDYKQRFITFSHRIILLFSQLGNPNIDGNVSSPTQGGSCPGKIGRIHEGAI